MLPLTPAVVVVVWVLMLSSTCRPAGSVDLTITNKATGSDVVEAVVDLIRQSCIFADDRLLLRRIAKVETNDGTSPYTFEHNKAKFYGGIWQVITSFTFCRIRDTLRM